MEDLPPTIRPPALALWGTAHLAWGVMIFVGLVVAAQKMPVESTPALEVGAQAMFFIGLVYLALLGWQQVDRGWRLRRPDAATLSFPTFDVLGNLGLAAIGCGIWLRGWESRVLASGLERLLIAGIIASGLSALLGTAVWLRVGRRSTHASGGTPDYRLLIAVFVTQALWALSLLVLESLAW